MNYFQYLRTTDAYKVFLSDYRQGKLSHAYLLSTEDLLLRNDMITLMAMTIADRGQACTQCVQCRKILNKTAIDYHLLDKPSVSVDDVNEILRSVNMTKMEGEYKIYAIPTFEQLNTQSQNKLLKTLEEPFDDVIFLLGTGRESSVLATVRSRCSKLRLPPMPVSVMCRLLDGNKYSEEQIETAAAASGGILTAAIDMLESGNSLNVTAMLLDILNELGTTKDIPDHLNAACFDKENIAIAIDLILFIFRDIMIIHSGSDPSMMALPNRQAEIRSLAQKFPRTACIIIMQEIMECKRKIRFNCNEKNIADSLLQKILEVRYKCLL